MAISIDERELFEQILESLKQIAANGNAAGPVTLHQDEQRVLLKILTNTEILMGTVLPGLAALQAEVATVQALLVASNTDVTNLTAAVTAAIAGLGASEDPAVQAAVAALTTAVQGLQTNQTTIESATASLTAAEGSGTKQAQTASAASAKKA
jgi:hypothetical protein